VAVRSRLELVVPIVATEEEPQRNGPTVEAIARRLPPGTPVLPKPIFGVAAVPEILDTLESIDRDTFVLAGLETDVCVAHSALGLIERGRRVAVVRDAVGSPGESHRHGLERMRDAGAVVVGAKGLYYEWVRDVASAWRMSRALSDVEKPEDLLL
jgi:nicotinamidase-related amidase